MYVYREDGISVISWTYMYREDGIYIISWTYNASPWLYAVKQRGTT